MSFYPILYGFVNKASEALYKTIFSFLRDTLAPNLRPQEIVTEYDADIYYALAETYVESRIGGSYFSYVQHLYKATAALSMGKQLETNSSFRNMYYMLLMLPLLPPTTIENAFFSLERQIEGAGLYPQMKPLLEYFHEEWLEKVTPEFFCVHRQENRLFTNVLAPYKKLKNMVVTCKTRNKHPAVIVTVLEKLVELESFLKSVQENPSKQWARDCNVSQKRMVLKAWQDIDENPKIKLSDFQYKVLGYLKCVENQLWIWGCYGIEGPIEINLINAVHFCSSALNNTENFEECQIEYTSITELDSTEDGDFQEDENGEEYEIFDMPIDEIEQVDQNDSNVVVQSVVDDKAGRLREENSQFLKFK